MSNMQIGPYNLVRELGKGTFGIVYLAEKRSSLAITQFALKLALNSATDLTTFVQESQLWANLSGHPNILPIIEADIYDGKIAIVSEYVANGSLEEWLDRRANPLTIEEAIYITCGILEGLEYMHSKHIVHRDLKPANILMQGKIPRLADFGLARVLKSTANMSLIAGTPAYMSPESFDGERSEQTDVWAVGVILYQLLSGKIPFQQKELMPLVREILTQSPRPLASYIPLSIRNIVYKALEKDPKLRYKSAVEMRNDLESVFRNKISSDDKANTFQTLKMVSSSFVPPLALEEQLVKGQDPSTVENIMPSNKGSKVGKANFAFALLGQLSSISFYKNLGVKDYLLIVFGFLLVAITILSVLDNHHCFSQQNKISLSNVDKNNNAHSNRKLNVDKPSIIIKTEETGENENRNPKEITNLPSKENKGLNNELDNIAKRTKKPVLPHYPEPKAQPRIITPPRLNVNASMSDVDHLERDSDSSYLQRETGFQANVPVKPMQSLPREKVDSHKQPKGLLKTMKNSLGKLGGFFTGKKQTK